MSWYAICVCLHLLAATLWLGHMFVWSLIVGPAIKADRAAGDRRDPALSAACSWAALGWPALTVLIVTGLYLLSARGIGPPISLSGSGVSGSRELRLRSSWSSCSAMICLPGHLRAPPDVDRRSTSTCCPPSGHPRRVGHPGAGLESDDSGGRCNDCDRSRARRRAPAARLGPRRPVADTPGADRWRSWGWLETTADQLHVSAWPCDLHRRRPGRARRLLHVSARTGPAGLSSASTRACTAGRRSGGLLDQAGRALHRVRRPLYAPGAGLYRRPAVRLGDLGALPGAAGDAARSSWRARARLRQISARPRSARSGLPAPRSGRHATAAGRCGPAQGRRPPAGSWAARSSISICGVSARPTSPPTTAGRQRERRSGRGFSDAADLRRARPRARATTSSAAGAGRHGRRASPATPWPRTTPAGTCCPRCWRGSDTSPPAETACVPDQGAGDQAQVRSGPRAPRPAAQGLPQGAGPPAADRAARQAGAAGRHRDLRLGAHAGPTACPPTSRAASGSTSGARAGGHGRAGRRVRGALRRTSRSRSRS